MAEIVSSAVIGEAVNRAITGLLGNKERLEQRDRLERLEMAHIKMDAALETSNKWQITDVPLLRWRKKLKRAAQECDDTLRSCKQQAVEDERIKQEVRQSSFVRRMAHATRSLMSSFIGRSNDEPSSATVRRLERFADGAAEFLKFMHYSGTPRQYLFFNPLVRQLLDGNFLCYEMLHGSQYRYFAVQTAYFPDRGLDALVSLVYADYKAPKENFFVLLILRFSESVDIIGTAIKSLQSAASLYKSTIDVVIKELTQLPTQDFYWFQHTNPFDQKGSANVHKAFVQRFRPDPFCCKEQESMPCITKTNTLSLSKLFPEPVIEILLQLHISLFDEHNGQRPAAECNRRNPNYLKLRIDIMPHDSPIDLVPTYESCAIEVIDGEEQEGIHVNVGMDKLGEVLLPKAIDYLHRKAEATTYQMFLKSKHGTAHIYLEKTRTVMPSAGKTIRRDRDKKAFHLQDYEMKLFQSAQDFLKLWVARSSNGLRDAIMAWIQKVNHRD